MQGNLGFRSWTARVLGTKRYRVFLLLLPASDRVGKFAEDVESCLELCPPRFFPSSVVDRAAREVASFIAATALFCLAKPG